MDWTKWRTNVEADSLFLVTFKSSCILIAFGWRADARVIYVFLLMVLSSFRNNSESITNSESCEKIFKSLWDYELLIRVMVRLYTYFYLSSSHYREIFLLTNQKTWLVDCSRLQWGLWCLLRIDQKLHVSTHHTYQLLKFDIWEISLHYYFTRSQ